MTFGRKHDVRVHPSEKGMVLECVCQWRCEVQRDKYSDCASMHREVDDLRWRHTARTSHTAPLHFRTRERDTATVN